MVARVLVLGTAQDGGVPHAGCACETCAAAREDPALRRCVASIGVVGESGRTLVVDATPDFPEQVATLAAATGRERIVPDGLLLTHAHVGHYLGLAFLGREAMDALGLPTYVSERMAAFLRSNRPWSWLTARGHVDLRIVAPEKTFAFDGVQVTPFPSPHRAEDTDTLGVEVRGPTHRLLYLPDADRFGPELVERIREADVALVDGTFWDHGELVGRDFAEIPHPFVKESIEALAGARGEVFFTHLNHSNPLLGPDPSRHPVLPPPFGVLADGMEFPL